MQEYTGVLGQDALAAFTEYLRREKGYSPHTVRNYRNDLSQFMDFLASKGLLDGRTEEGIEGVTPALVREYLGGLFGRYKRVSIARKLSAVRTFFVFLEKRRGLARNPASETATPKLEKYIPTYLPVDEMFRMLAGAEKGSVSGGRDLAIIEVLYSCGDARERSLRSGHPVHGSGATDREGGGEGEQGAFGSDRPQGPGRCETLPGRDREPEAAGRARERGGPPFLERTRRKAHGQECGADHQADMPSSRVWITA